MAVWIEGCAILSNNNPISGSRQLGELCGTPQQFQMHPSQSINTQDLMHADFAGIKTRLSFILKFLISPLERVLKHVLKGPLQGISVLECIWD